MDVLAIPVAQNESAEPGWPSEEMVACSLIGGVAVYATIAMKQKTERVEWWYQTRSSQTNKRKAK